MIFSEITEKNEAKTFILSLFSLGFMAMQKKTFFVFDPKAFMAL